MEVVCNPIRMGKWFGLMVVCVCHSDEVIREADAVKVNNACVRFIAKSLPPFAASNNGWEVCGLYT